MPFTLAERPLCLFRSWRCPSAGARAVISGVLTGGTPTSSGRGVMIVAAEDGGRASKPLTATLRRQGYRLPTWTTYLLERLNARYQINRQRYHTP